MTDRRPLGVLLVQLGTPDAPTPEAVRRFLEEAKVMAQLDHPCIVPVFEVGLTNGKPFYTMRVVHGRSLGEVLAALRKEDPEAERAYSLARRMRCWVTDAGTGMPA